MPDRPRKLPPLDYPCVRRGPLEVLGHQAGDGVNIAGVEGINEPLGIFDVLLRHRLYLKPDRVEGVLGGVR